MTALDREVAARVRRHGPLHLDEVLDLALYDPERGFYGSGAGAAGRGRDFLTAPEVGPLFGAVVARALDAWWRGLGSPDPFTVVEAAAGVGTLARTVLLAEPDCLGALTYVLVERSPVLRRRQADHLPLVDPALAFPPGAFADDDDHDFASGASGSGVVDAGRGPRLVSLPDLPALRVTGVVLANELLDNLAFRLLERRDGGWLEVRVGVESARGGDDPRPFEVLVAAGPADADLADRLAPDAAVGARLPVQRAATAWVTAALERLERGRLVVFDYAATGPELAARPWDEWVRTYRAQQRGGALLDELGHQDVTCEVDELQLELARRPDAVTSQVEFLTAHGIEELVAEGRRLWTERAHIGDLDALRARSRVGEAEALLDPDGFGAFRVLQWQVEPASA